MTDHDHRRAVAMSRFWWNRYRGLPKWRTRARRYALEQAVEWGQRAIKTDSSE